MRRKWAGILILAACASPLPAQENADDGGAIQVVGQPAEVEKAVSYTHLTLPTMLPV